MIETLNAEEDRIVIDDDALQKASRKIVVAVFPNAEIVELYMLSQGRVNDVYMIAITNPDKKLLLRLRTLKDYHYEPGVLKEGLVANLIGNTIRVPEIFVEDNSRKVLPCEFTLMEFIDGEVLSTREMTVNEAVKAGNALASIHEIEFASFHTFDQDDRFGTIHWKEYFKKKINPCLHQVEFIDQELASVAKRYFDSKTERLVAENAKPILNHHDYHGGNLISMPDGNIAVIDWDYASIGIPEIDFFKIKHFNFKNNRHLLDAFASGYQEINGRFDAAAVKRESIYEALWLLRSYIFETMHHNNNPSYFPPASYYKGEFLKLMLGKQSDGVTIEDQRTQISELIDKILTKAV